jgi:hypothetical protein
MSKVIKLKESDINKMVNKVIKEQGEGPNSEIILQVKPEQYENVGKDMLESLGRNKGDVVISKGDKGNIIHITWNSMKHGEVTIAIDFRNLQEIVSW